MRRHAVRQIKCHLVDVAPAPSFGRIIAFNNRVAKSVLWRDDWENHHSTRHSRMCGRDADEPKHRWSSDTPRNLARSVSIGLSAGQRLTMPVAHKQLARVPKVD